MRRNQHIARNFSRAAARYDAHAELQHRIMKHGYHLLTAHLPTHAEILDIGCGTGSFFQHAQPLQPDWLIDGADIAAGMCATSAPLYRHMVCADMCALPHANARYDGVFSNLAIQWARHLDVALAEIFRVLKPNGTAVIGTFLDGTLKELSDASARVGLNSVMAMHSHAHYFEAAKNAGFEVLDVRDQHEVHYLESAQAVMESLRAIGAKNAHGGRNSMVGVSRFATLLSLYEQHYRSTRGVSVSWHSAIFVLQKPA